MRSVEIRIGTFSSRPPTLALVPNATYPPSTATTVGSGKSDDCEPEVCAVAIAAEAGTATITSAAITNDAVARAGRDVQ